MDFGARNQRKSSSSDRFLGVFSPPSNSSIVNDSFSGSAGDELNEDDIFWTGDFSLNKRKTRKSSPLPTEGLSFNSEKIVVNRSPYRKEAEKFGILAALTDESNVALSRKPSFSPSVAKNMLAIPKPQEREGMVVPSPKYNFSAPVNVPTLTKEMMKANARRNKAFFDVQDDDESGEDEMLPPHEIVARGSALTPNITFSMLEGVGRTLKGRDLHQVRNAVFRQTGFLD